MTLEQLIDAGWSAGKTAAALGITRNAAIGRAWRLGLRFHSDDQRYQMPRGRQAQLTDEERRERHNACERERARRLRAEKREQREERRVVKRARLAAQFQKPGRILALCGWTT